VLCVIEGVGEIMGEHRDQREQQQDDGDEHHLKLRNLRYEDYEDIKEIMEEVYPGMGPWSRKQFAAQLNRFPEGPDLHRGQRQGGGWGADHHGRLPALR
jgi:hypothetical protein